MGTQSILERTLKNQTLPNGKCSNPQTNPAINPWLPASTDQQILLMESAPKEIEKLLPKSKGISDSTIASAAVQSFPLSKFLYHFPQKNSSFRIITISQRRSVKHFNSSQFLRSHDRNSTKGFMLSFSAFRLPFVIRFYFILLALLQVIFKNTTK